MTLGHIGSASVESRPLLIGKYGSMRRLTELLNDIQILREVDPEMTTQRAAILLIVMVKGSVQQRDVIPIVGLDQTAISRNVLLLSHGSRGQSGLGLIESSDDPSDRRQKLLTLTMRGEQLKARLLR